MIELKLPELGENISQGTVTKILVKRGEAIKKGQNILELETDKAVLEVPSTADGTVSEILIKSGAVIKVGQVILKLGDGASLEKAMPTRGHVPEGDVSPSTRPNEPKLNTKAPQVNHVNDERSNAIAHVPIRQDVPAAPSVRLLARELGIDIAQVPASSPGGRISSADVKAYCKILNTSRLTPPPGLPHQRGGVMDVPALPDFNKWGPTRREPMSNVRKKTAEHLSIAWQNIPHVTQFDKADITELEKLRKNLSRTQKISVTPFIIKVVATALREFPQFNASIDTATGEIIFKNYINIGLAVDTDRGLIVPVLKNVDKMSILQISDELTAMAERARLHKTTIEEMQGGCFTISNLGGIGGNFFTPIINWPEVAILGVSRGALEPTYAEKHCSPRLMLPLSLSYDHRIIDGADGARFIRWICEAIQQPFLLDLNK